MSPHRFVPIADVNRCFESYSTVDYQIRLVVPSRHQNGRKGRPLYVRRRLSRFCRLGLGLLSNVSNIFRKDQVRSHHRALRGVLISDDDGCAELGDRKELLGELFRQANATVRTIGVPASSLERLDQLLNREWLY